MDGVQPNSVVFRDVLLVRLRAELKARTFQPMPVRERLIPKAHGKVRMLGIATARDRVVQASLKLVLEPIFEADFKPPCSYGFVRHEAPFDRVGGRDPPAACRSRSLKLGAA